jgi:hypothetical protein
VNKLTEREEQILQQLNMWPDCSDQFKKHEQARQKFFAGSFPANKKLPDYFANCLTLKESDLYGKHIRTTKDLPVGSIVIIEKPFVGAVDHRHACERCEYCHKKNVFSLIPCQRCTSAMYCSEKCQKEAWQDYHKYLCGSDSALKRIESCAARNLLCWTRNIWNRCKIG